MLLTKLISVYLFFYSLGLAKEPVSPAESPRQSRAQDTGGQGSVLLITQRRKNSQAVRGHAYWRTWHRGMRLLLARILGN